MTAPKIHLYSLSDLKTTLDDHLPLYLSTSTTPSHAPLPRHLRFTPSYTATYIRLGLGYAAVAIAAYIFYLDYVQKIKFTDIKLITALAVVAYFTLNGLLSLWLWFGERGLIFSGSRTDGVEQVVLRIRSLAPHRKYEPSYKLVVEWSSHTSPAKGGSKEVKAPFTGFFAEDGTFRAGNFEAWVRKVVPLTSGGIDGVGKTETGLLENSMATSNDGSVKGMGQEQGLNNQRGDTIVLGGASTDAVDASPKKRGRPRKSEGKHA